MSANKVHYNCNNIKMMLHEKNAFETFIFLAQHQLLEHSIHIRFQGTFHISLKICVPLFQAPFENISNNDHTNICRDILNILIRGNDSGTDTFLQIIVYSHDRVRTFGTDQWVQRLIFRSILIRHKFNAEFLTIMHIIQVDVYNGRFNFISTLWHIKKIWVNIRLLFNIVGKQIIFCLKMMIKTSVRNTGFFTDIFDGESFISVLLQNVLCSPEDLSFRLFGLQLLLR